MSEKNDKNQNDNFFYTGYYEEEQKQNDSCLDEQSTEIYSEYTENSSEDKKYLGEFVLEPDENLDMKHRSKFQWFMIGGAVRIIDFILVLLISLMSVLTCLFLYRVYAFGFSNLTFVTILLMFFIAYIIHFGRTLKSLQGQLKMDDMPKLIGYSVLCFITVSVVYLVSSGTVWDFLESFNITFPKYHMIIVKAIFFAVLAGICALMIRIYRNMLSIDKSFLRTYMIVMLVMLTLITTNRIFLTSTYYISSDFNVECFYLCNSKADCTQIRNAYYDRTFTDAELAAVQDISLSGSIIRSRRGFEETFYSPQYLEKDYHIIWKDSNEDGIYDFSDNDDNILLSAYNKIQKIIEESDKKYDDEFFENYNLLVTVIDPIYLNFRYVEGEDPTWSTTVDNISLEYINARNTTYGKECYYTINCEINGLQSYQALGYDPISEYRGEYKDVRNNTCIVFIELRKDITINSDAKEKVIAKQV